MKSKISRIIILSCFVFFMNALQIHAAIKTEKTESTGSKSYVITPDGENDFSVLNKCLHSNGDKGVKITLSPGTYYIDKTLHIYNNTTISAKGAAIIQKANGKGFLVNARHKDSPYGSGSGGYKSCKNITIDGGTWIGTSKPDTSKKKKSNGFYVGYSGFMFMHGENITIKNAAFKNNYNGHFIEFAGIKNGTVTNCNMNVKGSKYIGESSNEAIQIDNTYSSANSPIGSPWDDTPCSNITVKNCKIKFARGLGTNRIGKKFFTNIKILNNTITSNQGEGINAYDIKGLTIKGNTITVTHKKNSYESVGVYLGLDSKISSWGKYKTVISNNKITGYTSGLKIYSFVSSKFGNIELSNNTFHSTKSKKYGLTFNKKQIKKLTQKGNKIK